MRRAGYDGLCGDEDDERWGERSEGECEGRGEERGVRVKGNVRGGERKE